MVLLSSTISENYIVEPVETKGIAGFLFDIEGDTEIELTADITDHYVEDNTAVQDHIALKPIKIVLKGYMGELIYEDKLVDNPIYSTMIKKLSRVNQLIPAFMPGVKNIREKISTNLALSNLITEKLNQGFNLWEQIKNANPASTRQAQAYLFFENLWKTKSLVSVTTPFRVYEQMVIESIRPIQKEETKYSSDFAITLKEFRGTEVKFVEFNWKKYQDRYRQQIEPQKDKGKTQGEDPPLQSLWASGADYIREKFIQK